MKWYKIVRKTRLNKAAYKILKPLCQNKKEVMTPEQAEKLLTALRPRRDVTCIRTDACMQDDPTVDATIIIPTWNNAAWITDCIHSVLHQKTNYSYQVIIVNDGSTDDTAQKLAPFESDPRVTVIHQKNQGVSAARNNGLDRALGRYLYFLDGDDLLMPDMLDTLLSTAICHDASIVEGGYQLLLKNGQPGRVFTHQEGLITDRHGFSGFVCGKLFHRDLFKKIRFPDISYEDSIMTQIIVPMILQGKRTAWGISKPVFSYRYNPTGITQSITSTPKAIDNLYITEVLMQDRETLGLSLTQGYYEHLLDMMAQGWKRAEALPQEYQRALFVLFRALILHTFPNTSSSLAKQRELEAAIRSNNFKLYQLRCSLN